MATYLGRPSTAEMSAGNVACGTRYICRGKGKAGAEQLSLPTPPEAQPGTGHSYIYGSGQTTSALLPLHFPISKQHYFHREAALLAVVIALLSSGVSRAGSQPTESLMHSR